MNTLLKQLLLGGSTTALVAGASFTAAYAQPVDTSGAADIETVTSSASRIDLKGFEAPTPVTVIGVDTLNRDAKVNIGDQIRELPQVRGGNSITTGSSTGNLAQVNAGADTVSIRGLGSQRNLVLFDHQRVVSSNVEDGTVDISLIPAGLTQRVDVVTGGASAAWGSDAVTGVVNIVLNKTYEGFKGSVNYTNSTLVEDPQYRASFAWGTSFLGGKGHVVAAADFKINNTSVFPADVARNARSNGRNFVYNSAYCSAIAYPAGKTTGGTCATVTGAPLNVYGYGTGGATAVQGGLVTSNTAGAAGSPATSDSIKGTMFLGPDAAPAAFNYGTLYNGGNSCYNGCTNNQFGNGWGGPTNPYHSATYFLYTSYQLTPDIKASVQLNYGRLTLRGYGNTVGGNRTIYADNAFLPDSIAQSFVCAGGTNYNRAVSNGGAAGSCVGTLSNGYNPYTHGYVAPTLAAGENALDVAQGRPSQTLRMGFEFSGNRPNPSPTATGDYRQVKYDMDTFCAAVYQNCGWYNKALMRGVFTLEGSLGDDWAWNAYIEDSQARVKENIFNVISNRVSNALDAVRVTAGNQGTSGLPIGSIQCRSRLNPSLGQPSSALMASFGFTTAEVASGCEPYDPFGEGQASSAVLNYVKPSLNYRANGELDGILVRMHQVEGSATMNGVLPWQLPAGEVAVAFGAEWRLEQSAQTNFQNRARAGSFPSGNFGLNDMAAHLHSEEGFLEVAAPLLKDTVVQTLDLDVAGRMTYYSFSGLVETWKIGLTSQVNDDFRLRFTWSYDIRAPDNWDLYAPGTIGQVSFPDFTLRAGIPRNSGFNVTGGNPNLVPEKANTVTAGIVMTPHWIDGLTASVDWYQIHLHDGLTTPGGTLVTSRCQQGELSYCKNLIFRDQGSFSAALGCGSNGNPLAACNGADTLSPISYVLLTPLNAALYTTAGFDFNVAYGFDLFTGTADVSFNGNYVYDFSRTLNGVTFQGAGGGGFYGGGAKFQGNLNMNYREGPWSFGLQVRMTGESVMDLGTEGQALLNCQGVTYTQFTVNGATQNVASFSSGQRCSAETNYNAMSAPADIRIGYRWNNNINLQFNINNVQDLPTGGGLLRRTYTFAVRWNY